jgi:hypothetical protein
MLRAELQAKRADLEEARAASVRARLHIALLEAMDATSGALRAAVALHPTAEWADGIDAAVGRFAAWLRRPEWERPSGVGSSAAGSSGDGDVISGDGDATDDVPPVESAQPSSRGSKATPAQPPQVLAFSAAPAAPSSSSPRGTPGAQPPETGERACPALGAAEAVASAAVAASATGVTTSVFLQQ